MGFVVRRETPRELTKHAIERALARGESPVAGYRFVLQAEDGRVVATSETYATKRRCLEGIESVERLAADAPVQDETPDT